MAKRFTDTEKWEDEWFTELPNDYKVIWFYLLDTCDNAGIWKRNIKKLNYLCNTNVSAEDLLEVFNKRIQIVSDDKWFIKKFCIVQYGHDYLQSNNKAVKSAVKRLQIEGVLIGNKYTTDTLSVGYNDIPNTPKEQEQVKDKDKEKDKEKAVYSRAMLERVIDRFVNIDSRFKFNSVMREIDEDYGGFTNLIEMYLPNDTSAQNNFIKQLNEYKNGIFYNQVRNR
jgi:hypothetical protein